MKKGKQLSGCRLGYFPSPFKIKIVALLDALSSWYNISMKYVKRIAIESVRLEIISLIFPYLSYSYFYWIFKLEPNFIWKWTPLRSPFLLDLKWFIILISVNFLFCIFLSALYDKSQSLIKGNSIIKGIKFGIVVFFLTAAIPIFSIYILTIINPISLLYFLIEGLIECILYGLVLSCFNNKN